MNKMKLLVVLFAAVIVLSGCGGDQSTSVLRYGLSGEPNSLDPGVTFGSITHTVMMNIFDTLVFATTDGTIVPGLAESWEVSADRTRYTFKLRQDVKFHDGTPFNAEAVQFTFDRMMDPELKSRNAKPYLGPYLYTEIIDDYMVTLVFSEPYEPLLLRLTRTWMGIVSPTAVNKDGDTAFGEHPVGTGPFMFKERVGKSHITLVRNPDYNWGPAMFQHRTAPRVDELIFRVVPEAGTRVVGLENNELDVIEDVPEMDAVRLAASRQYGILESMQGGIPLVLYVNCAKAPTDSVWVRRALNLAIDQQAIVDKVLGRMHTPAYSALSPATWGYNHHLEQLYPYDPDQAALYLMQAGYVLDGDMLERDGKPLSITLIISTGTALRGDRRVAEMIQSQLRAVGIDCRIQEMNLAAAEAAAAAGEHHLYMNWGINEDADVLRTRFGSVAVSGRIQTFTQMTDPMLDDLLLSAYKMELRDPDRKTAYEHAQHLIMAQAMIVPVFNVNRLIGTSARVQGISFDVTGAYTWLHEVRIR